MTTYKSDITVRKHKSESFDEVINIFSGILARRLYGKKGRVGTTNCDSWTTDGKVKYYNCFIGSDTNVGNRSNPVYEFGGKDVMIRIEAVEKE